MERRFNSNKNLLWIAYGYFLALFFCGWEDYLIQINGKRSIPKSTDMYARYDQNSLVTNTLQRFYSSLRFSCRYWEFFAKHYNMCEKLSLFTWQSKSDTTFSWWSSCNERYKRVVTHQRIAWQDFVIISIRQEKKNIAIKL